MTGTGQGRAVKNSPNGCMSQNVLEHFSTLTQFWNECLQFFSYPYLPKDEQAFSTHFGTTQKDVSKYCSLLREVVKILEVNVLLRLYINRDISTLGILTWHGG